MMMNPALLNLAEYSTPLRQSTRRFLYEARVLRTIDILRVSCEAEHSPFFLSLVVAE